MSGFDFGKLDLSGVDADEGPNSNRIGVGIHNVTITSAAVENCSNPAHQRIRVNFADANQKVALSDFNVVNGNPKSVEIGKAQFKSLLECSKHPNPDKPNDITTLTGLRVQIDVKMGNVRKDGKVFPEIKSFAVVGDTPKAIDDIIPF